MPAGPPLVLGSAPFATAEWEVTEGIHLVLYGHGLTERRRRGADAGLALLRGALSRAAARTDVVGPEETCAAVLDTLLPVRSGGAVALLVARTRGMPPDQVADRDVPAEPAAVADLRTAVTHRLAYRGLDGLVLTTELILSELVNNAIRYTTGPIHLRLLCDHTLTCEVFDSSSAFPHPRQASTTDEDGRGLLLIARLAERWGTRHTRADKVVWTEQPLPRVPRAGIGEPPSAAPGHPSHGNRTGPSRPLPGSTRGQSPRVDLGADTPLQTPAYPRLELLFSRVRHDGAAALTQPCCKADERGPSD
ncbi:ATP-binding protein [Streptomyces sp. RLB1-33]|nr:ATP-binding protein [Streptomyces sp. RLB1-33]QIY68145.1 SpoIIE family protein phosphatase [Streptomyces sp. RLB1-33]